MISTIDTSLLQNNTQISENSDELENFLKQLSQSADDNAIDRVIALYEETIVSLEQKIWQQKPTHQNIKQYQNAFTVLEKLHQLKTNDNRYNFKIVIPVADRPQHLKHCLDSLLTLCKSYAYGGYEKNQFNKISVLIADDSENSTNIKRHKSYCKELSTQGINTEYFGLEEQLTLVKNHAKENSNLVQIISETKDINNTDEFSHKGASIMRNITYLKLNTLLPNGKSNKNSLIYFIDSDQEFCINTFDNENNFYAINYFHCLNQIFKTQDISILTGKVVGDPPVSPSVMAGNFQQDVQAYLNTIKQLKPEQSCQFHQHEIDNSDDAAYHDMAKLFDFSEHEQAFDYHCSLPGKHNNSECFQDFSSKLSRFFYGEHPTRKTFFHYDKGFSKTTAARTVYTGNYVIKPENLEHFIPFATLKLRMAGPVLGRLLNAKLQGKFVSANLPMLHNRTVDDTGQSEFRAGVEHEDAAIDLGNEFIRQFYGDVMLFSIKKLTEQNFPYTNDSHKSTDIKNVQVIVNDTYKTIKQNYIEKHDTVLQLKSQIQANLDDTHCWWNTTTKKLAHIEHAKNNINNFLKNIQANFDENSFAFQQISSAEHAEKYLTDIKHAILHYQKDTINWNLALKNK